MNAARTAGTVALLGAGVLGVAAWAQSSGWSAPSDLKTSAGSGGSRAQQLSDLRELEASLEAQVDAERGNIAAEFERRMSTVTASNHRERIERECKDEGCAWWAVVCHVDSAIDPYRRCDDRVLEEIRAEHRAWRANAIADVVAPLEARLGDVRGEIDSLLLTS